MFQQKYSLSNRYETEYNILTDVSIKGRSNVYCINF